MQDRIASSGRDFGGLRPATDDVFDDHAWRYGRVPAARARSVFGIADERPNGRHKGLWDQQKVKAENSDQIQQLFLSTDAGGVGLNLQPASAVVNFEPPWNPARLEQRIGRVHWLGQSVQVVHLLTTDRIEERVWETLRLKKPLFAGVLDSPAAEVSFAKLGRKSVLQEVKEIFANQPGPPRSSRR